ncbi:MAG: aldehyde dehydrogenase family protein [Candidatus Promineifilaceae bacterium]
MNQVKIEQAPPLICYNPATGQEIGRIPQATAAEIDQAYVELHEANSLWSTMPTRERVTILRKMQYELVDAVDEITTVINKDTGKSRQDALIELYITLDNLQLTLKHAEKLLARRKVSSGTYLAKSCYVEQRPYGTIAIISPWNYPFMLAMQPVLTALAAGNTVILKPSEVTGVTGKLMAKLFQRVPELAPFVRVLHGDGRVGAAIVEGKPDLIYLTGSTRTGKLIAKAAAENLIPTIFELGGKDPMIVLEGADLDAAAKWGIWGATTNAGQACTSVERTYVVDAVYDQFVEKVVEQARLLRIGYSDEVKDMNHYGPLSSERQATIVEEQIDDALEKGAQLLTGARRQELMMQPTILVDVDPSMKVLQNETFGPVMPIVRVRDEDDAIARANTSEFGLSAYVWGKLNHVKRVLPKLEAGTVVANDVVAHFAVPSLPFGGLKKSGNGRSHGDQDLLQFTQTQSFMESSPPMSLDIATRLREPGNYRLAEAVLKAQFGANVQQKLTSADVVLNSYKVRTFLSQTSETATSLFSTVSDAASNLFKRNKNE